MTTSNKKKAETTAAGVSDFAENVKAAVSDLVGSGSQQDGIPEEKTTATSKNSKKNATGSPGTINEKAPAPWTPVVVIPFKASMARSNELQYAVRAWAKHLPGCKVVVIGDKLPWFGKGLGHIPMKPQSKNPQIDVAHKMMAAIASDLVPDFFIWSNDDIYPVCNISISDIDVLKSMGRLGRRGSDGSIYRKNAARTLDALKKSGIRNPWDYATHTPVTFYKEPLADVISKFKCDKEGHLVSTLYFNTVWQGHNPIRVNIGAGGSIIASIWRKNADRKLVKKAFEDRQFINNSDAGWSATEPFLKKLFPKKCRFEK